VSAPENHNELDSQVVHETFAPISVTERSPQQFSDLANQNSNGRKRRILQKIALSAGFVLLLIILGTMLYRNVHREGDVNPSNQVKSVLSDNHMQDFHSPENNFTIRMPGYPVATKATVDGMEQTTYQRTIENETKQYIVVVYDLPVAPLDVDKALQDAFDKTLGQSPNIKVMSRQLGLYNADRALEVSYTTEDITPSHITHSRFILRGSKIYEIRLPHSEPAEFVEYANGFRLG
jgi:hypothetical protein